MADLFAYPAAESKPEHIRYRFAPEVIIRMDEDTPHRPSFQQPCTQTSLIKTAKVFIYNSFNK
jgi:hypothetical protein